MATRRSCCILFSCFSSDSSDENGEDPASASARNSPSAIDNIIETLPGAQAPTPGSSNVDVNLNVSGTHQRGKAPLSESLNIVRKYEDEDVNVNLIVSGATQCDEAPSSSSSFSRVATKSDVLNTIIEEVDVNLDDLMNHISELLKLREEETLHYKRLPNPSNFPWPDFPSFKKLNAILSPGTDLKTLKKLLSSGLEVASELKDIISGPVRTLLNDIGRASVATAGLLVVANTLERFEVISTNKEKCWALIKEMSLVAFVVKTLEKSPRGTQDIIKEATLLVAEGAIMCCTQIDRSAWKSFLLTSKTKDDLTDIRQKLNVMYMQIDMEIGFRVLTAIERNGRSPLSRRYPKDAVGIAEPIEEVLRLLKIESDDQNAVTVILHGVGGMGKTTLADAVVSTVGGCKYSKVRLSSTSVIENLQNQILGNLMEPGQPIPNFSTYEEGQRELETVLQNVNAFIYIDDVREPAALKKLLPEDLTKAKKVRILLTARDVNVKYACPRPCTEPEIYSMKGMTKEQAMELLPKDAIFDTYPIHAVGIAEPVEEVLRHLKIRSDDQNAVTVILHGFGGMGKTTLADAVFSEIGGRGMVKTTLDDAEFWEARGGKRSKVRLFDSIKSTPDITALQKQILKDLMEPGETIPKISTHKDGQRALEGVLRKIHAFIYIDNVLEAAALEELLPQDMTTAKKVRLLLTARDENVKNACPRSRTEPKFYNMQTINDPDAMVILKREIEEGVTETQFSDIIQICGGIPLMLTLAAASIGHADNKEEAYATLKEQKGTNFEGMRYAFAYDNLPHECKDPFQDICTYFNGWNWDIVKDIVGDDALMKLKSRALVTRTTNGFASVHDVIIALAHVMSKEQSKDKEVRCIFTNASELKKFLEEGDTEGITGIWLTERKEDGDDRKEVVVQASALDKMQKSLRVLQLGNSVKVEGNCNEIFKELCFFKANISRLPFTVSQLPQLRYLSYDPPNWVRSSLPSSLAIMNFDGKTFQTYN